MLKKYVKEHPLKTVMFVVAGLALAALEYKKLKKSYLGHHYPKPIKTVDETGEKVTIYPLAMEVDSKGDGRLLLMEPINDFELNATPAIDKDRLK